MKQRSFCQNRKLWLLGALLGSTWCTPVLAAPLRIDDFICTGVGVPAGLSPPCLGAETTYDMAFRRAEDSFPYTNSTDYSVAGQIDFGRKTYAFSAPISIYRELLLKGEGGAYTSGGTILTFNQSAGPVDGIRVYYPGRYPVYPTSCPGAGGYGCGSGGYTVIRDLVVRSVGGNSGAANGITLWNTATLQNVSVQSFSNYGVLISSSLSTGTARGWRLRDVAIVTNASDGLHVDGNSNADSNAGVAESLLLNQNGGWGVNDHSFGGNTYIGNLSQGNVLGSFKADSANGKGLFLDCYQEQSDPPPSIIAPNMVIGGVLAGLVKGPNAAVIGAGIGTLDLPFGAKATNSQLDAGPGADAAPFVTTTLGSSNVPMTALEFVHSGESSWPWRLTYDAAASWWYMQWAGLANGIAFALSVSTTPEGSGQIWTPNGIWLGPSSAKIKESGAKHGATYGIDRTLSGAIHFEGWASSAPSSGTFLAGDIVWNTGSGSNAGWRYNGASWVSF